MQRVLSLTSIFIFLTACQNDFRTKELSSLVANQMSCESFESQMFDSLHAGLEEDQRLPVAEKLIQQLKADFQTLENYEEHKQTIDQIITQFEAFYTELTVEYPNELQAESLQELQTLLSQIETRDGMTKTKQSIQERFRQHLSELQSLSQSLKQECTDLTNPAPTPEPVGSLFEQLERNYPRELYGTYKTFATAYQNCEALNQASIKNSQVRLEGVVVTGRHSSGGGNKREISSLRSAQNTHPYLSERAPATSCFSTYNSPLIYDYGGKPYSSSSATSELNFFKNHGTGTGALGTDCSGFIFTALATAGLKLHPNVNIKARDVLSYNAARFKNPTSGGTTCFRKIAVAKSESLNPGDIVASSGHIFIVTKTGADPLGAKKANTKQACSQITVSDFDFELAQSSPTNNAIGINKMTASYYLTTSPTMRNGMLKYAKKVCETRFSNISEPNITEVSVVRHKKTPACLSDFKVSLTGSSCVADCRMTN